MTGEIVIPLILAAGAILAEGIVRAGRVREITKGGQEIKRLKRREHPGARMVLVATPAMLALALMLAGTLYTHRTATTQPSALPPVAADEPTGAHGGGPANPTAEERPSASPAPVAPLSGTADVIEDLPGQMHQWYARNLEEQRRLLECRRMAWRIDVWLSQAGSPMAGTGACFVENANRTGIPAALPIGIAWAESSAGLRCYRNPPGGCSYNAYGMIGPEYRGGFSCWEEGIAANFDFLVRHYGCPQSMYQCRGYCEGNTTMRTVDDVQRYVERIDASWIQ